MSLNTTGQGGIIRVVSLKRKYFVRGNDAIQRRQESGQIQGND